MDTRHYLTEFALVCANVEYAMPYLQHTTA